MIDVDLTHQLYNKLSLPYLYSIVTVGFMSILLNNRFLFLALMHTFQNFQSSQHKHNGDFILLGLYSGKLISTFAPVCFHCKFSFVERKLILVPAGSVTSFKTSFLLSGYFGKMANRLLLLDYKYKKLLLLHNQGSGSTVSFSIISPPVFQSPLYVRSPL